MYVCVKLTSLQNKVLLGLNLKMRFSIFIIHLDVLVFNLRIHIKDKKNLFENLNSAPKILNIDHTKDVF